MADLLSGGAVGAVTGEMLKHVLQTIQNGREFGPTLEMNVETLNALAPLVEEMKCFNYFLDRPREEIERLETHISEGKELVRKSKKLNRWKFLCFPRYKTKLQKKDEELKRHLNVNVQVENRRDLMDVLAHVKVMLEILGQIENPRGLNQPIYKLKIDLIKNGAGLSLLALTGSAGSGKTTLVKKLCSDPQIKGKFRGNIFYIIVTRVPNLKYIVQELFFQCGCHYPQFRSEEDAINQVERLLRSLGRNPILLVLDDIYPGSEGLVDKFKFQMSNYKILVISRYKPKRFGTPYQLDPLDHDYVVSPSEDYFDQLDDSCSHMPDKKIVHEEVRDCKCSPLAPQVNTKEDWTVFFGVVAGLSILSSVGTSMDFLRFICIGMLIGMAFPVTYKKNVDKIKRCMEWLMEKYKRFYEIIDEDIKKIKSRILNEKKTD